MVWGTALKFGIKLTRIINYFYFDLIPCLIAELHKQHQDKLEDITQRFDSIKLTLSVSGWAVIPFYLGHLFPLNFS